MKVLFPDTFNNFFCPDTLSAATRVLEAAGFRVVVPDREFCCGRPLYDYGMLDTAKLLWRRMFQATEPFLRHGVPVVGTEPSCVACFRDELPNLFPHDADASRLAGQTLTLAEDTLIVADGFSCRTQIEQLTGRRALHTAQMIELATER